MNTATGPGSATLPIDTAPASFCPRFHHAIELIGRRWTGAILRVLLAGPTRFTDVTTAVPGLSDRLLSERLKELEAEGIVVRSVYPETPVRIEYAMTEKGRALEEIIVAVAVWAEQWVDGPAPACDEVALDPVCTAALVALDG